MEFLPPPFFVKKDLGSTEIFNQIKRQKNAYIYSNLLGFRRKYR